MATRTWTGAGLDALASNAANWDGAPAVGDSITFDGVFPVTGNNDCTWDITTNFNSIDIQSGYSGDITLTAAMNVTNAGLKILSIDNAGTFDAGTRNVNCGTLLVDGTAALTLLMGTGKWTVSGAASFTNTTMTFDAQTSAVAISGTGSITTSANVTLYHFRALLGSVVTVGSNLDINGNLRMNAGATLDAGSFTINVAGDWVRVESGSGTAVFIKGTSTVIFDGVSTLDGATDFHNLTFAAGAQVTLKTGHIFSCSGTFSAPGTSGSQITLDAVA